MNFIPSRKKIIAALMMGAFAGGMAPIFVAGANTACISTVSVAHAASCPTPTKRYQEAARDDSEDKVADATESVSDNIFKAAWRIALLVAAVFLARIGWKHFHKKKNA